MTRAFIFSNEMKPEARAVIDSLAAIDWLSVSPVLWVETDSPQVAELLSGLDTAEEIPVASLTPEKTAKVKKAKRQQSGGPTVECPVCHQQKTAFLMTKAGPCKVCRMRALKSQKSQGEEKSQAAPPATEAPIVPTHSAMPPKSEHFQENRAERLSRPRETVNLARLSGRKVG